MVVLEAVLLSADINRIAKGGVVVITMAVMVARMIIWWYWLGVNGLDTKKWRKVVTQRNEGGEDTQKRKTFPALLRVSKHGTIIKQN